MISLFAENDEAAFVLLHSGLCMRRKRKLIIWLVVKMEF